MDSFEKTRLTEELFFKNLSNASPVDIADFIEKKSLEEQLLLFNILSEEKSVLVFEYLPFRVQKDILLTLPSKRVANLLNIMAPDDRTALLEELPEELMQLLLKYLSPEERALSVKLLKYPEKSIGRLMTPEYLAIKMDWTIQKTLDYIREHGKNRETVNIVYAIDDQGILIDDFRIQEFLFAPLNQQVKELADYQVTALHATDEEQTAIQIFRKYDRIALPVVDTKGLLLGIVTMDDIMDVAEKENTEDIQKFGAVEALEEPYMNIPLFSLIKKRIGWLFILFIGELFTASAMIFFQNEIAKAVTLALFLPLIISTGGNAGSQASTLIIRALALGEITLKDGWKIIKRELASGILLGFALGTIGFLRVFLWSTVSDIYGEHWFLVGLTIFFALIGIVLFGTLCGSMLPLLLKRCGMDPAVSSAPFVATLVDVTGIIIYFSIAIVIMRGSLL